MNNILIIWFGAIWWYIWSKCIVNWDNVFFLVKEGSNKFKECLLEEKWLNNVIKNIKYINKEELWIYRFDFIIVCVKTFDTDDIIHILTKYNIDISKVLVIQNGLHILEEKYCYIPGIIFCNIVKEKNIITNLWWIPKLLIKNNNISFDIKKYLDNVINLNELDDIDFYYELYNKFIHIVIISSLTSFYEIPIKDIRETERYRSVYNVLLDELILFFNIYKWIWGLMVKSVWFLSRI